MDYDKVLDRIGGWGKYQKTRCFLLSTCSGIFGAYSHLALALMLLRPPHYCPEMVTSNFSQTTMYLERTVDSTVESSSKNFSLNMNLNQQSETLTDDTCDPENYCSKSGEWQFDFTEVGNTATSYYNFVCSNRRYTSLALIIYTLGDVTGVAIWPYFLDNLGRKPSLGLGLLMHIIPGTLMVMIHNVPAFLLCVYLKSISISFTYNAFLVIIMELVSTDKRTFVSNANQATYAISMMSLGAMGYLCKDWITLGLLTTLPMLAFFALGFWFVDESIRWMISRDVLAKPVAIEAKIKKIAKINGKLETEKDYEELDGFLENEGLWSLGTPMIRKANEGEVRLLAILKNGNLRNKTIIIVLIYIMSHVIYYTQNFNTENLPGNPYLVFSLCGLAELPSPFVNVFAVERFGRIRSAAVCLVAGGTTAILTSLFPSSGENSDNWAWVVLLASIAKLLIAAGYVTITQITAEHYPTVARGAGVGFVILLAHIANALMPAIRASAEISQYLPMIILGTLAVTAATLCLFLPETTGKNLPQTFEDAVAIGAVGFRAFKENLGLVKRREKLRRPETVAQNLLENGFDKIPDETELAG